MGSDESHFNALLTAMGQVTRQCPQTTTFEELGQPKRGVEPTSSAYQPNALPLSHTGLREAKGFSVDLRVCSRSMGFSKPLYDDARDKVNG